MLYSETADTPFLVSVIMNQSAGHHAVVDLPLSQQLQQWFAQYGCEVVCHVAEQPSELAQLTQRATRAHRQRAGVIVAAGGDGTINTVAQYLLHQDIPMAIVPLGTFNYVARALNIPLDLAEAVRVAVQGVAQSVHVGTVNQQVYLNNAAIGLYPKLIQQRESDKSRFGRYKAVAMLSGFAMLLREHQKLRLKMTIDGQAKPIETPMVFFGNNQLQLADMKLTLAECAAQGRLAGVAITPVNRWQMLKLMARMSLGTFERAPEVHCFCADHIQIASKHRQLDLAIDGEIVRVKTPLNFKVANHALKIMVPNAATPV